VSASPAAGGTVSGGGSYASGASVTVIATQNSNYNFVNWTESGNIVSTSASYNFTASSDRTLVANFVSTLPTVATPTITPNGSTGFIKTIKVTLKDATSGATIYYTTNGSTPTTSSTRYSRAFSVTTSSVVKAIAVRSGYNNSQVASATFTRRPVNTPTISPNGGTFTGSVSVTLRDSIAKTTIYYTTDGQDPTTASTRYSRAFTLSGAGVKTVKTMAIKSGYDNSAIASATFTIQ
jgi:hypothetical protein